MIIIIIIVTIVAAAAVVVILSNLLDFHLFFAIFTLIFNGIFEKTVSLSPSSASPSFLTVSSTVSFAESGPSSSWHSATDELSSVLIAIRSSDDKFFAFQD